MPSAAAASQNPGSVYLLTNFLGRRLAGNLDALPQSAIKGQGWIEFSYPVETFEGLEHHRARAYHLQSSQRLRAPRRPRHRGAPPLRRAYPPNALFRRSASPCFWVFSAA